MKFTLLGTGTSTGVPSIGCECETCTSDDPRDKRLRVSVLVEHEGQTVLVDTSSDFRQQALRQHIKRLDAVLITHCHADHVFGLDDIRPLNFRHGAQFCLGPDLLVTPVEVIHGRLPVVAYRFNDFAYATDLSEIPPDSLDMLRGLDALVLDCLRLRPHPTHLWLERSLAYIEQLKPRRAYFTHIAHDIKHARDSALLPDGVEWGYDGLTISDED